MDETPRRYLVCLAVPVVESAADLGTLHPKAQITSCDRRSSFHWTRPTALTLTLPQRAMESALRRRCQTVTHTTGNLWLSV